MRKPAESKNERLTLNSYGALGRQSRKDQATRMLTIAVREKALPAP